MNREVREAIKTEILFEGSGLYIAPGVEAVIKREKDRFLILVKDRVYHIQNIDWERANLFLKGVKLKVERAL